MDEVAMMKPANMVASDVTAADAGEAPAKAVSRVAEVAEMGPTVEATEMRPTEAAEVRAAAEVQAAATEVRATTEPQAATAEEGTAAEAADVRAAAKAAAVPAATAGQCRGCNRGSAEKNRGSRGRCEFT